MSPKGARAGVFPKIVVLLLWLAVFPADCSGQNRNNTQNLDTARPTEERVGDLRDLLVQTANEFRLPMVMELAQPLPEGLRLRGGERTPRQTLDLLVAQCPEYIWQQHKNVVYFYHKGLKNSSNNFLNWKISSIRISNSVADIEMRLRAEINKSKQQVRGTGGLSVGLYSTDLSKHQLPGQTLRDVTVREVILKVAQLDQAFYSLIIFGSSEPRTDADLDLALSQWRWRALPRSVISPP
jgi:hypothetical protein